MKLKKTLAAVFAAAALSAAFSAAAFAAEVTVGTDEALRNAIAGATDATTIKLENDIAITDTVTIGAGQDITFDFGEHTLSCTNRAKDFSMIKNSGKLTVLSGTITGDLVSSELVAGSLDSGWSDVIRTEKDGTLIIGAENSEVKPTLIVKNSAVAVSNNGGNIIVNNAVLESAGGSITAIMNDGGHTTLKAGTFGDKNNILPYFIRMKDGTVDVENDVVVTASVGAESMLMCAGGTLNLNFGDNLTIMRLETVGLYNNAVININSGNYKPVVIGVMSTESLNANVNINGGIFDDMSQCDINTYEGSGTLTINGGTFTTPDAVKNYLAQDKEFDANGTVVDKGSSPIDLGVSKAFVNVDGGEVAGQYFDVVKTVDEKKMADVTFTSGEKSVAKTLDLSMVDGGGSIEFSILLRGAPEGVTGTIFYR